MFQQAPSQASLWLIGNFDLRAGDRSVHLAPSAQRLLAFLALQRRSVTRRAVTNALWTDLEDRQGAARLRSILWRLPTLDGHKPVELDGLRLQLSVHLQVDVWLADSEDRIGELDIRQLSGDLLIDWTDDWIDAERERFRQLRLRRLEQLSEHALRQGRFDCALQAGLAAVALEPLRESAHRRVMLVHLAEENPSEALRQYDIVRRLLRSELGLSPSGATRAVVARLLGRPLDAVA